MTETANQLKHYKNKPTTQGRPTASEWFISGIPQSQGALQDLE